MTVIYPTIHSGCRVYDVFSYVDTEKILIFHERIRLRQYSHRWKHQKVGYMPATLADIQRKYGESVLPLYKDQMHEPYMEEAHGYLGVVLYDEHEDKIQCAECGNWYQSLQTHLIKAHNKTTSEYKEQMGLNKSTALCSVGLSNKRSIISTETFRKFNKEGIGRKVLTKKWRESPEIMGNKGNQHMKRMIEKNKHGLCDAQISSRLVIVRDMAGKQSLSDVTTGDLQKYDKNLYSAIYARFGSYKQLAESLGIKAIERNTYQDSQLIADLRMFVTKNKYIPSTTEITKLKGYNRDIFNRHFGSWRRAKMMAGLDQLLEEIKHE